MIHVDTKQHLSVILPQTNKALQKVLQSISQETLHSLTQKTDIATLLQNLLKNSASEVVQNKALLQFLNTNATFKELSNIKPTIDTLLELLSSTSKPTKSLQQLTTTLQNLYKNIQEMTPQELQSKLQNSGVFLESKLKYANDTARYKDILSNDLKAVLLHATKDLQEHTQTPHTTKMMQHLEKLTLQIDYYQLYSHLANGSAIYLPYHFDALEDAHITIKKGKTKNYFCDINLTLKEYGELFLRLGLFDENSINITVQTQNTLLKKLLQTNIQQLKQQLVSVGLHVGSIDFIEKTKSYDTQQHHLNLGFEAKV